MFSQSVLPGKWQNGTFTCAMIGFRSLLTYGAWSPLYLILHYIIYLELIGNVKDPPVDKHHTMRMYKCEAGVPHILDVGTKCKWIGQCHALTLERESHQSHLAGVWVGLRTNLDMVYMMFRRKISAFAWNQNQPSIPWLIILLLIDPSWFTGVDAMVNQLQMMSEGSNLFLNIPLFA